MTPVFCCGFECGVSGAHWTLSGGPTFEGLPGIVRTGTRSLSLNQTTGTATIVGIASGGNKFVARFYVYIPTGAGSSSCIFGATDSTGFVTGVNYNAVSGKIEAQLSSNNTVVSGFAISQNTWHRVDVKINISSNPWTINLSVDGDTEQTGNHAVAGGTFTSAFRFGDPGANSTFKVDDFILSLTDADYPLGAGYVNHFIPTADGTHNIAGAADFQRTLTGTDILNATTTAYQLVDDVPLESSPVDWINMIAPPNATDYVECVFGPATGISTPTAPPRTVEVVAAIHQAGTANGNMEIRMNDNGTTNAMYTATGVGGVTSLAYKRKHYATNIANGGAWTLSGAGNFNNLRVRFGSPATLDVNPDQYFDCIMVEAEFVEVSIPNKKVIINQAVKRSNTY